MMSETLANFIRVMQIDSFQKLRVLLFLHQYPDFNGTGHQFAERLSLGDVALLERIIRDLRQVGLVVCTDKGCKLRNESQLRSCLLGLARAFEDPLARQDILDRVRKEPPIVGHNLENLYEYYR
jgi:hypothetical protein